MDKRPAIDGWYKTWQVADDGDGRIDVWPGVAKWRSSDWDDDGCADAWLDQVCVSSGEANSLPDPTYEELNKAHEEESDLA